MSANSTIQNALDVHLWAMPERPPISWPNKPFDPPAETYLIVDRLPRETDAPYLADDSALDYGGIYQLRIMAPADETDTSGTLQADAIQAHFSRGDIGSGVRIRKTVIAPGFQDGTRWVIPVSVYYRAILSTA